MNQGFPDFLPVLYFQSRVLPRESHSIAVVVRFFLVSGRFASEIHSMYSLCREGLNLRNVDAAAGSCLSAALNAGGTVGRATSFVGAARG